MSFTPDCKTKTSKRTFDVLSPTGEDETQEDKCAKTGKTIITFNMEGANNIVILTKLAKLDEMSEQLTGIANTQTTMQNSLTTVTDKVNYLELQCTRLEDNALKCEARFDELARRSAYLEREIKRAR